MKSLIAIAMLTLAASISAPSLAAGEHAGHAAMLAAGPAAVMAEGLVKKVDKPAGKVTIAHGPLLNLSMPAMTMAFNVKDAAWLDQLKEGDRIRFIADNLKGGFTVVQFEKAK